MRSRLDGLTVEVDHAARVAVGERLPVRVTVTNRGARTSSEALLCLHTHGLADVVASVARLDPGDRTRIVVRRLAGKRTVASGSTVHVVSRASLGLVVGQLELSVADHVVVHPALRAVPRPDLTLGADGERAEPGRAGAGPEILGVREWRAGDDTARVHWRTTARTGRPALLERGQGARAELRVVVVGSDASPGFEEALGAAASCCDLGMEADAAVAAVAWHTSGPVLSSAESRLELLDWWASVHDTVLPDPGQFGRTMQAGFGGGDLLVAGPPEADHSWLSAAAAACPAVLLRPLRIAP
jgi:uncharacterized protein (DUF58 family)